MEPRKRSSRARRKLARERKQILIVDDEESLAFFLRQGLLEVDSDWLIDTAATGEEAVIKINRSAYELIIADLRMPGLNGLELIQMIRALEPGTRVILMTAYGSTKVEEEARRLGVFRYVAKPFSIEDMKTLAAEALGAGNGTRVQSAPPTRTARAPLQEDVDEIQRAPIAEETPRTESMMGVIPQDARTDTQPPRPMVDAAPEGLHDGLRAQLSQIRVELRAQLVLVAGHDSGLIASSGDAGDLDVGKLVALCTQSLQIALEGRHLVGEGDTPAALLVQQGQKVGICSATIGRNSVLIVVREKGRRPWRLDSVVAAVREATAALEFTSEPASVPEPETPRHAPPNAVARRARTSGMPTQPDELAPRLAPRIDDEPHQAQAEDTAVSLDPLMPKAVDDANDESDDQVLSLDQAKALGLIDGDLLDRILGE